MTQDDARVEVTRDERAAVWRLSNSIEDAILAHDRALMNAMFEGVSTDHRREFLTLTLVFANRLAASATPQPSPDREAIEQAVARRFTAMPERLAALSPAQSKQPAADHVAAAYEACAPVIAATSEPAGAAHGLGSHAVEIENGSFVSAFVTVGHLVHFAQPLDGQSSGLTVMEREAAADLARTILGALAAPSAQEAVSTKLQAASANFNNTGDSLKAPALSATDAKERADG